MAQKSPRHGLTRHPRGAWYKSINGEWKCIAGKREAPTAADADRVYERKFRELWAGAEPRIAVTGPATEATLAELFDHFFHAKQQACEADRLKQRTLDELEDSLKRCLQVMPDGIRFSELQPLDFTRLHQAWSKSFGVHRLSKYVANVRSAFNWMRENGLIPAVPLYGDFRQPTRAEFRKHKAKREESGAASVFSIEEITRLLDRADVTQRAQILLALNSGFGNTDLSELRARVIDFARGWIDYTRGKTGVKRRCPLWPETLAALKEAIPHCRITGNVFSTSDGRPLVQGTHDRLAARFKTLCEAANCYIEDRGFYALRHNFSTEAMKHGPTLLIKRITGHTSAEEDRVLDEHYVGETDARLCEIVDGVRHGLIAGSALARLEEPLLASPQPKRGRRRDRPRSRGEEKRTHGRTAGPE